MSLKWLEARHFRNLTHITTDFDSGVNLLFGDNGSGKTSILEAGYFLSTGRSFRDSALGTMIQSGAEACVVRGKAESGGMEHCIGISRGLEGNREIKIDSESTNRSSELAKLLPTLVLGPHSVDILLGSPILRRRFLNWGLFHVKPGPAGLSGGATVASFTDFSVRWKEANRCLRQRNLLLREQAQRPGTRNLQELEAWSELLASHAIQIDEQRKRYVELYQPFFADVAGKLSGMEEVRLDYYRGWNRGTDLRDIYQKESGLEQKRGFTQKGFQRADVRITVGGQSAAKVCSRGELKLLVWAMILAQGALASEVGRAGERGGTLYLVDDLASELDREHRKRVCDFLLDTGQQVLLTGVDEEPLLEACGNKYSRLFHVKHGQVIVQEY